MNRVWIQTIFSRPWNELKMRSRINGSYSMRSPIEVVRKIEEFKLQKLEFEKRNDPISLQYQNYIEALLWVIHADSSQNGA